MAISFIKNLKAKADKIRATIEEGSTTLRELREEVEGTVEKLKVDSEEKLMDTVTEIQESTDVFDEAGYELIGLRIEMGFNPKVVPRIRRIKDISDREFRRLIKKHEDREVVAALLTAIRKAEELEDKVSIKNLELCSFEIEVGVVPAVHVTWAKPEPEPAPVAAATPSVEAPKEESTSKPVTSSLRTSSLSSGGYKRPEYQTSIPSYSSQSSSYTSLDSRYSDVTSKYSNVSSAISTEPVPENPPQEETVQDEGHDAEPKAIPAEDQSSE